MKLSASGTHAIGSGMIRFFMCRILNTRKVRVGARQILDFLFLFLHRLSTNNHMSVFFNFSFPKLFRQYQTSQFTVWSWSQQFAQGYLLKDIVNLSGAAWSVIRTVSVTVFLYFNLKQKTLFTNNVGHTLFPFRK